VVGADGNTSLNYSLIFRPKIKKSALSSLPELYFRGGQGVRVAIIDSGVNNIVTVSDHVDYTGFGTSDGIPTLHGTIVAAIIKHFAKNAHLINIKVTQTPTEISWNNIFSGLKYARDQGAHIVNLSIGHFDKKQCQGKCNKCREVQAFAKETGMIIVAAAGNLGPTEGTINCPAVAPDVIAVGMVDKTGKSVDPNSSRSVPGVLKPNLLAVFRFIVGILQLTNGCSILDVRTFIRRGMSWISRI
jgi:subtilisin family serine protease